MRFYLGTHETSWLGKTDVPLFVSRRRLAKRRTLPRAFGYWALDSGGFTELQMYGRWETPKEQYADEAMAYRDQIGNLEFAAIQDWMCEPIVIAGGKVGPITFAGTHLSVPEHQRRTIQSYLDLKALAPDVPWIPVLQGWEVDDYLDHVEQYRSAGIDLARFQTVGVGSVCRRQATQEAEDIFYEISSLGIRCHGFGLKTQGLVRCATVLASADSMAWSFRARRSKPLAGCAHKSCANCLRYALLWRERVLEAIASSRPRPRRLWAAFSEAPQRIAGASKAKRIKPVLVSSTPRPHVPLPGQRSLFDTEVTL